LRLPTFAIVIVVLVVLVFVPDNTRIAVSRCSITLIPLFPCLILAFATSFALIALVIPNYQVIPNTSFLSVARPITNLVMAPLAGLLLVTGTFSYPLLITTAGVFAITRRIANLNAVAPAASVFVTGAATYRNVIAMAGAIAFTGFFTNIDTITLAACLFITGIVYNSNVIAMAGVFCVAGISAHRYVSPATRILTLAVSPVVRRHLIIRPLIRCLIANSAKFSVASAALNRVDAGSCAGIGEARFAFPVDILREIYASVRA
jgi:hypothetical protein